jgi:cold-inducible RNA-binding protein
MGEVIVRWLYVERLFRVFGHSALSSEAASLTLEVIMGKKLYVGNIPYSATEQSLTDAFAEYGTVESAKIIMDRDSGRSKGFAFVEMSSDEEAQTAISKLNGNDWDGRAMTVNEARPMAPREGGGGGRSGGSRDGGGRGNRW